MAYCMQVGMLVTGNSDVKVPYKGHPPGGRGQTRPVAQEGPGPRRVVS